MDFTSVIEKRYSVRAYMDKPVEPEKLARILHAAQTAPTACNLQAFKVFVIPTDKYKDALGRVYNRAWLTQAPVVLLVCTAVDDCWVRRDGKSYGDVDSAIVMDHIILAATDEGLGTCWIGAFDAAAARAAFCLPDDLEPVAMTPVGYARDTAPEKRRKELNEIVEYL